MDSKINERVNEWMNESINQWKEILAADQGLWSTDLVR
jgi:hypothetical protein